MWNAWTGPGRTVGADRADGFVRLTSQATSQESANATANTTAVA
jgi:hypothetical protein